MGYMMDAKRGVIWIGGYRAATRIFSIFRTALLARLLSPAQFGVYGIAVLILSLLEIVTETGINTVLIQKKGSISEFIDTAWVVSILRGTIIAVVVIAVAPIIASFFNSPEAQNLLYLTALVPFIRGFINPSLVNFQRDLRFKTEFFLRTTLFIIDSSVAVVLTILTGSPYALIWGLIAGVTCELIFSHLFIKPRPRLVFHNEKIRYVLSRGKWMTFTGFMDYMYQNGDNIVVGRLLGTAPLGFYQASYQYATAPVTEVSNILSRVAFPVFMKINTDKKRLHIAFIKMVLAISLVVIPFGSLLIIFSRQIILILLGPNWIEAAPLLAVLALVGIVRSLVLSVYALFLSLEKQELVTVVSMTGAITMLVSIPFFINSFGLIGACYASLLGSVVSGIPAYYFFRKQTI